MGISEQAPSLADLVIIITGAGGAIGGAAASVFAQEAHGLVLFGHRANDPEGVKHFARPDHLLAISGDITSPEDVRRLMDLAIARFGRVDALINCAGIVPRASFMGMSHQEWQAAVETNLVGYALLCRTVLPYMLKNGFGRIVNIATRLAASPGPHISAYSSSKAGAHILMRCIAAELVQQGQHNILINDLVPGPTRSSKSKNSHGQDPIMVVPFLRQLILLPPGGPTGKTFFRGQFYDLFGQH